MAQIKNMEGLSTADINRELDHGGKFVMFQYCISILIMTFKRPSDIYFVRSNESPMKHGAKYIAMSLLLGWWGIPWGPIYTISSLATNFSGGKDVTQAVLNASNTTNTKVPEQNSAS